MPPPAGSNNFVPNFWAPMSIRNIQEAQHNAQQAAQSAATPTTGAGANINFGGPIANAFGNSIVNGLASNAGFSPYQFSGGPSMFNQQIGSTYQQAMAQASAQASTRDRQFVIQTARGLHTMAGGGTWGEQQERAAGIAADRMSQMTSQMAMVAPDLADSMHGSRGSASVMSQGVVSAMRFMRDGQGRPMNLANAGQMTNDLFDRLHGPESRADMNGLGAGRTGQMMNEMSQRGMLSGASNTDAVARRLQEMSGAVSAVRDLFGANGRPNAPMRELMDGLEALTQGSSHSMSPGNMQMMVRRIQALTDSSPGGLQRFTALAASGGQLAAANGLDRSFGMQTAQASTAFGTAFGNAAGGQGFGGMNTQEATMLDQQLRTAAAGSAQANALGGLMAASQQNLLNTNSAAGRLAWAVQNRNDPRARQLLAASGNLTPQAIQQMMQEGGMSASAASTFLNAGTANQEQISQYGLGDIVRQNQGAGEIADVMNSGLQGGMMGGFGEAGFNAGETQQLVPRASEAARQALMGMNGDLLSNPERRRERNEIVQRAIVNAIGPEAAARLGNRVGEIAASAIRGLEGTIGRNPTLARFRNLAGLVSMNSTAVATAANAQIQGADQVANAASQAAGTGNSSPISRIIDSIAGAGSSTTMQQIVAAATGGVSPQEMNQLNPAMRAIAEAFGMSPSTTSGAGGAAAAGGGGGGLSGANGPVQITGTLNLNANGTGTVNATTGAGTAPSPG